MQSVAPLLEVREEHSLTAEEVAAFGCPLIENAALYLGRARPGMHFAFATVRAQGSLIGLTPLITLARYRSTRLLKPDARRWLDPLVGPFARKTTCMIETSLMGFLYEPPFFAVPGADRHVVRNAVVEYLKSRKDLDTIVIIEPAGDTGEMASAGFDSFMQLPMILADVGGCRSFDDYLQRLSPKRRKNTRHDRALFANAGAVIRHHAPPHDREFIARLHRCLMASAERNTEFEVPYADLINDAEAFRRQRQPVLAAWLHDQLVGFFAYITRDGVMHQCHGGLDYSHSQQVKAYPNLLHAAVETAIAQGLRKVSFGPLNNEAKRRVGKPEPQMISFRCRSRLDHVLMSKVLAPRLQVYMGPVVHSGAAEPEVQPN